MELRFQPEAEAIVKSNGIDLEKLAKYVKPSGPDGTYTLEDIITYLHKLGSEIPISGPPPHEPELTEEDRVRLKSAVEQAAALDPNLARAIQDSETLIPEEPLGELAPLPALAVASTELEEFLWSAAWSPEPPIAVELPARDKVQEALTQDLEIELPSPPEAAAPAPPPPPAPAPEPAPEPRAAKPAEEKAPAPPEREPEEPVPAAPSQVAAVYHFSALGLRRVASAAKVAHGSAPDLPAFILYALAQAAARSEAPGDLWIRISGMPEGEGWPLAGASLSQLQARFDRAGEAPGSAVPQDAVLVTLRVAEQAPEHVQPGELWVAPDLLSFAVPEAWSDPEVRNRFARLFAAYLEEPVLAFL